MTAFLRKALNYGIRNGLSVSELLHTFSTGTRCSYFEYLEILTYFRLQENLDRYYTFVEF